MTNIKVALRTVLNPDLPSSVTKCGSRDSDKSFARGSWRFFLGARYHTPNIFLGVRAAGSGLVQGP